MHSRTIPKVEDCLLFDTDVDEISYYGIYRTTCITTTRQHTQHVRVQGFITHICVELELVVLCSYSMIVRKKKKKLRAHKL